MLKLGKNFKIVNGKIERVESYSSVSEKIRRRFSKKVKPVRRLTD